jgi:predicted P-loop ATPase
MSDAAPILSEGFAITVWGSLTDPQGIRQEETWDTLLGHGWWRRPAVIADKVRARGWSPAIFAGDRRAKAGVEAVFALVLDYEAAEGEAPTSLDDALDLWRGCLGLLHTSYSHTPERPRFRVIVALSRAVTGAEYGLLWRWAATRCAEAGHQIDEACRDPSRLWFLPAVPPGGEATYQSRALDGGPLDVDAALGEQREREAPPPPPAPRPRASAAPAEGYGPERFCARALEGAVDDVRRAPKGSRHNVIRAKAYQLAGLLHTGALTADQIETALLGATRAAGWADEPKTAATIRDQIKAGARAPRQVPELRYTPRAASNDAPAAAAAPPAASDPVTPTDDTDWHALLISRRGEVTSDLANLMAILEHDDHWRGRLRYNEARQQIEVDCSRSWQDHDDTDAAVWFQRNWKLRARPETVCQAVQALAQRQRCNPLASWLQGLRWDGVARLDTWLTRYAGAKDSAYTRAAGACWLRSAVARALQPGVKADAMLVLEGLQEAGKSSLFRIIGGEYFTDDVHDLASKDAVMAISRAWIVELPELSSLGRAEVELIKAFLSRQVDRIRPPNGRAIREMPRRCIFGGTTNRADYLKDDTGNRRFWPVGVGLVDLAALEADREQLLAEAVASWLGGAPLYLPREVRADHAEAVEERRQEDPWETEIARWLVGRTWATSAEVLGSALQIPTDRWSRSDQMRAGQVLARLGWKKRRVRVGAALEWRYEKDGGTDVPT